MVQREKRKCLKIKINRFVKKISFCRLILCAESKDLKRCKRTIHTLLMCGRYNRKRHIAQRIFIDHAYTINAHDCSMLPVAWTGVF